MSTESPAGVPVLRAVMTPCIGVCALDRDGRCMGCLRTGEEIGAWMQMSDAQRQYLMDVVLPAREQAQGGP